MREVARAISADIRIGGKFLQAGPGFGGSCFQNNILNLMVLCRHDGLLEVAATWEQVVELNTWQQHRLARLVVNRLFGTVTGKRIGRARFCVQGPHQRHPLIPSHPHLPRPAGGRCRAGDRGSQGERTPDRC